MFDGNFEEIHFKTPSVVSEGLLNSCSHQRWNVNNKRRALVSLLLLPLPPDWVGSLMWLEVVMIKGFVCNGLSQFFSCRLLSLVQVNVGSYLQLLCLVEDVRTDLSDISSLLRLNGCDIRQSLLQLQFWTRSAGGRNTTRPLMHADKNGKQMSRTNFDNNTIYHI